MNPPPSKQHNKRPVVAIIGTGAVGGYYGARLQQSGIKVHFLLHHDYQEVQRNGLRVDSPNGNFVLPSVHAYHQAADLPRCDWIVIALKTTANSLLKSILTDRLTPNGFVLTLQNGLGSEESIASIVGKDRVMGGLCFLCANKIGPGRIHHLDYGSITLGEYRDDETTGNITPRIETVAATFRKAGIPIETTNDLALARWKKLVWNIPFNGLSVLHHAQTDRLVGDPKIRMHCERLMQEVANASIRPIENNFLVKMMAQTMTMKPYAPSMKLDYDRGNPMELESIYGNPIRSAQQRGIAMPETEALYQQLRRMDRPRYAHVPMP